MIKNLVFIPGPVGQLETLHLDATSSTRGLAVICHPNPLQGGNHHNKVVQTIARTLVGLGFICYCPNLRGVGSSEGVHDHGAGEVDDVLATVAWARQRHGPLPLVLAGFSFGAFVAARARAQIDTQGLILVGLAAGKYSAPLPDVPADTLVIHGEADDVIPLSAVLDWARAQHLPVLVFPGAVHFFHGQLLPLAACIRQRFRFDT